LLIHPDKPGLIRIDLIPASPDRAPVLPAYDDWQVHRYRSVDDPSLAETIISELLGVPLPGGGEPIGMELSVAEQAFRDFTPLMTRQLALRQRCVEELQRPSL
jgi:hypothetical protein